MSFKKQTMFSDQHFERKMQKCHAIEIFLKFQFFEQNEELKNMPGIYNYKKAEYIEL
jgi:hypothetical protein